MVRLDNSSLRTRSLVFCYVHVSLMTTLKLRGHARHVSVSSSLSLLHSLSLSVHLAVSPSLVSPDAGD